MPPKCPELNPVENVWKFLRDNWLSNHVFKAERMQILKIERNRQRPQ